MKRSVYFSPGLVLFVGLVILWIPWLGESLFYSKGEPREAIVAMSMLQSGDWILPVSCGTDIPFKPPFLAWLIAVFAKVFNGGEVNEFVSRLPSALAAIALVMGSYRWARRVRGDRFAVCMALILATSVEFYRAAAACRVDMVLTACMVGAMYVLYNINANRGHDNFWRYLAATLLLTCAVLTKGPVGALLPCFVMGIYFLFSGERFLGTLGRMLALSLAACVIPAVWYYYAWQEGGSGFLSLVWEENFQRLTGTMPYESHVKPFWYNFVTVIIGMLPWTLLAVMAVGAFRHLMSQPLKPAGRLALTVIVTVTVFYCIPASKRSVYLLPIYPFLAYAVASMAESLSDTRINLAYTRIIAFIAIAAPLAAVGSMFYPLPGFTFEAAGWWSYAILAVPLVVAIGWFARRRRETDIHGACIITWAILVAYGGAIMPATVNPLSDKPEAAMLEAIAGRSPIYVVGPDKYAANAYCINYYTGDRLRRLSSAADADTCAKGTVLIFPNLPDTVGLPATYHLTLLKSRLADTRRPALFAVQTGAPVRRCKITAERGRITSELPDTPPGLPAAVDEMPAVKQSRLEHQATHPADTAARFRVRRIDRDSVRTTLLLAPAARPAGN